MSFNKKGAAGTILAIVAVVALLAMVGLGWYAIPKLVSQEAITTPAPLEDQTSDTVKQSAFCANNPDIDWETRAEDSLTETTDYRAGNLYIIDKENGQIITEQAVTTTSSTRTDLTDSLKCGHEYEVWGRTDQDSNNYSATSEPLLTLSAADTSQDPLIKDLSVKRSTADIKIRCYDNLLSNWMYQNDTESTTATDYVVINDSGDVNFTSTTGAGTNMALDNSANFDVTCELKTNDVDMQFGLNALLGLDYSDETDVADWDDSEFALSWNGEALSELAINDGISSNDAIAMTGKEKFYKLAGGVTDSKNLLNIQGLTASSGTVDRDLVFQICGTGTYVSDADGTKLLKDVCFRDDSSTRSQILTATSRGFRFLID